MQMSFGSSKSFMPEEDSSGWLRRKLTLHELYSHRGLLNSDPNVLRFSVIFSWHSVSKKRLFLSCSLVKVTSGFLWLMFSQAIIALFHQSTHACCSRRSVLDIHDLKCSEPTAGGSAWISPPLSKPAEVMTFLTYSASVFSQSLQENSTITPQIRLRPFTFKPFPILPFHTIQYESPPPRGRLFNDVQYRAYVASADGINEWLIGRVLEGRGSGLFEVMYRHLREGTEQSHENPQSGKPVSLPRLQPSTSRIQIQTVTSTPTCLVVSATNSVVK
jgi:hypothetical protein